MKQCDVCGKEVKNLGVHKRFCGKAPTQVLETIKVDEFTEKPLSVLISELKEVIRKYPHELDIRVSEKGGRVSELEMRVRIHL